MRNPLNKRSFWVSFIVHFFLLLFLIFFYPRSKINKKFLVYGVHSKNKTLAYFKPLRVPASSYKRLRNRAGASSKVGKSRVATNKTKQVQKPVQIAKKKETPPPKVKTKMEAPSKKLALQKKVEPKKKVVTKAKKEEPKKLPEKKLPEKKILAKNIEEEKPVELDATEEALDEQLHFNVVGEDDQVFVRYQKYVQQEVEHTWKPPLGVPKGTECTVLFEIGSDGCVKQFEFVTRSNILIYDLSITRVAKLFKFDSCLWGKTFKVDFRQ
jgi:hypothetical protein